MKLSPFSDSCAGSTPLTPQACRSWPSRSPGLAILFSGPRLPVILELLRATGSRQSSSRSHWRRVSNQYSELNRNKIATECGIVVDPNRPPRRPHAKRPGSGQAHSRGSYHGLVPWARSRAITAPLSSQIPGADCLTSAPTVPEPWARRRIGPDCSTCVRSVKSSN
jgi:hypothetical protein